MEESTITWFYCASQSGIEFSHKYLLKEVDKKYLSCTDNVKNEKKVVKFPTVQEEKSNNVDNRCSSGADLASHS